MLTKAKKEARKRLGRKVQRLYRDRFSTSIAPMAGIADALREELDRVGVAREDHMLFVMNNVEMADMPKSSIFIIPKVVMRHYCGFDPDDEYTLRGLRSRFPGNLKGRPLQFPSRTQLMFWSSLAVRDGVLVKNRGTGRGEPVTIVRAGEED